MIIIGTSAPDRLDGGGAADQIFGRAGGDHLFGGGGNNSIFGESGNDLLAGNSGDDRLDGGADVDWVYYRQARSPMTVDLRIGRAFGDGNDTLVSIENIDGSEHGDVLHGSNGSNVIAGYNGNDSVFGYAGIDHLFGGGGNDSMFGGSGNDLLAGNNGNDSLDGGSNIDWVHYRQATSGVTVDLRIGRAFGGDGNDTLVSIENIDGSEHGDVLHGSNGSNVIAGYNGNDIIVGNGGVDHLVGGAGNDQLGGGSGNDVLDGGTSTGFGDVASYQQARAGVTVDLRTGRATGGEGSDILVSIEGIDGSLHDDVLHGDGGANAITGRAGIDQIYGYGGNDLLYGVGPGPQRDGDEDRFYFSSGHGTDRIGDFEDGTDKLVYSGVDFGDLTISENPAGDAIVSVTGNPAFGQLALTGMAGQVDPSDFLFT